MAKKKLYNSGLVYSTNPTVKIHSDDEHESQTLAAKDQPLIVKLDSKNRSGKVVTVIQGFSGKIADVENIGKQLKSYCGTGGSVKNNEILVQGDNRQKVFQWLTANGYAKTRKQ